MWSSSLLWEWLEYTGEAIVIIGVVFEGLTDFELILKGDHKKALRDRVERLSFLVLTFGLAIGLIALFRTNQLFAETIVLLQRQARDANTGAINALQEALKSSGKAEKASYKAAKAEDRANRSEQQAAQAIESASENAREASRLNKLAADEGLARAELEARIAPRTLSLSERERIGRELTRFATSFFARKVKIHWQPNDLEAAVFGVEIRDALMRASIQFETDGSFIIGTTGYGVLITGTSRDMVFIKSLYSLLHAHTGSDMSWEVNRKYIGLPVSIEVATKPLLGLNTLGQILPIGEQPPRDDPSGSNETRGNVPDRHLTTEQQSAIGRTLRPFIGQRASIVLYSGDPEIMGIAVDIDTALNLAGWIRSSGKPPVSGAVRGILIEVGGSATSQDRNAAEWLAIALGDRLNVIGPLTSNLYQPAPIKITIGRKP